MSFLIRKLKTREDPHHIHKVLGIFCLCNYVYRYLLLVSTGDMNLNNRYGALCILAHALLSGSSLIFHIPRQRNPLKPMIYPEYRLHSIVFALRSVVCCLLFYITLMHSSMQIGATIFMLHNINTAFSAMFAIQVAALLMTLVRKSIISSNSWHILYSFSLWINSLFFVLGDVSSNSLVIQIIIYSIYTRVYFPYRINKYIGWTISFILYHLFMTYIPLINIHPFIRPGLLIYYMTYLYTTRKLFIEV